MSRIIRLYDRSRVTTDWKCPRARYWQYEWNGKGLVKAGTHLELFTGTLVHDSLATIAVQTKNGLKVDIETIATNAYEQMFRSLMAASGSEIGAEDFAREQGTLIEGMIRGFHKHCWPRLIADYPEILYVEQEMEYAHDQEQVGDSDPAGASLLFMAKPDLILADREGNAVYVEYKTTRSKKEDWINSWDTAVQLHSSIKAVKASTGIEVGQVIVQGLYKGYESYGKQSSPFCYAYKRSGNPPFTKDEIGYEYRAGFKRYPTWELPGGVAKWVESMPDNVLADQFPRTAPIFINDELVDGFFRQCKARESEIEVAKHELESIDPDFRQHVLDVVFPQKFDQCMPAYGRSCEFRKLCFGAVDDPLTEGYQYREPHHEKEVEQWAALQGATSAEGL